MAPYMMFLDDEREVSKIYPPNQIVQFEQLFGTSEIVVARSFEEAVKIITDRGCPIFLSFDNDLGGVKEGYDLAVWLTEADLDGKISIPLEFDFWAHTANCIAWPRIQSLLDSYWNFKYTQERRG